MRVGDGTPGPGRPKGIGNKTTRDIKEMILAALNKAGGVEYLAAQAKTSPIAFLALLGKLLPMQVTGKDGGPLEYRSLSDEELERIARGDKPRDRAHRE